MTRPRPRKTALFPRLEGLEIRALLSVGDYGQWPLLGADPSASLIVKFAGPPLGPAAQADLARFGAYVEQTYEDGASLVVIGQGVDRAAALAGLQADADVDYAEANGVIHIAQVPNDPSFPAQWGLNNPTGVDIDAERGWNITTGSASTVVAVVDTGIDMTNPELASKLWANPADGSHGWNYITNTNSPQDDNGHGSHVSGIVAAATNNGVGVAGVNWNAKIMALKFLDASGSGSTSNAVSAIQFAVANGARVINASWGGTGGDPALQDEINWAGTQGVVFVAAAGNNGSNNDTTAFYPASYHLSNMLTVAAVDSSGNLAGFSNFGPTSVDVAAPGVNIYSTYLMSGGGYATLSGTSMATPFVTALVSLLDGLYPGDTAQQIVAMVKSSARPLASLAGKVATGGIIDVGNALATAGPAPSPVLKVSDGPASIANGGSDAFGSTLAGTPVTRTFTVADTGNAPLTLSDPIGLPAGFSLASDFGSTTVAAGGSTSFAVTLTASAAGSYSGTVSFGSNDPANPTFRFNASGTVAAATPVLKVSDGPTSIANGGSDAFGSTAVGTPLARSFTVTNAGTGTLTLSDPIALPAGFSLAADFGSRSVAPGGTTSFGVTLAAAVAGSYSGQVRFGSNDPTAPTFSFNVAGTVTAAPSANPLASSFNRTGIVADGSAFSAGLDGGSYALSANLLGTSLASGGFTFALGEAGTDNVVSAGGQVVALPQGSDSTLSILGMGTNGGQAVQHFKVLYTDGTTQTFSQRMSDWWSPQGFAGESVAATTPYVDDSDGGRTGQSVNVYRYDFALDPARVVASVTLPGNPHVVLLSMALQAAKASLLGVSDGGTTIANGGSDAFGSTTVGSPVVRTFTVTNAGTATLTLSDPIGLPAGFSLASDFGSRSVAPGGTTSFAVALTAAVAGSYSGTVSFGSNDPTAPTFRFNVAGTVAASSSTNPLATSFNRAGIVADGSTFSGGLDGGSYALSANLLGSSISSGGSTFPLGAPGSSNVVSAAGQAVALPQGGYSTLSVLGMATYGAQAGQVFTVHYTDGSTQAFTQTMSDWWSSQGFAGESVAATTPYIDNSGGGRVNQSVNVYRYDFALNPARAVASVTLPSNGHVVLLSIALH